MKKKSLLITESVEMMAGAPVCVNVIKKKRFNNFAALNITSFVI